MRRTQKLILLMAILVITIGGLNADYTLNIRTFKDNVETFGTLIIWKPGFELVTTDEPLPYTKTAGTQEELYGYYQPNELDLPFPQLGHFELVCETCNLQIDENTNWGEADEDGHYTLNMNYYWVEDNVWFSVVVNAYDQSDWLGTPYPVYVTGPTEISSGTTTYYVYSDNLDDVLGTYTPEEPNELCKKWIPQSITLDFDSDWQEGDDAKDPRNRFWEINLDFTLFTHNDWTITAVDCITQEPIPGATVWYDADCEGEGEPEAVGLTDENGKFIFYQVPVKGGEFNDPPVGETYYQGSGCYYLTHPSYIAWSPDHVYQSESYWSYGQCLFTEFCGSKGVPVELSSFTAAISALNNVALTWVTQTETGMRGYYVHRAEAYELANAQTVSPLIASSNSSQQQSYYYEDAELMDSGTYYYWLEASDLDGSSSFHGPVSVLFNAGGDNPSPGIPLVTQLHSVYPNPFNPITFIPFSLAKDSAVDFKIYNSRGQLVKHFDLGAKSAGMHRISWDGADYNGKILSNGVYNIVMNAGKDSYQTKAVLLK